MLVSLASLISKPMVPKRSRRQWRKDHPFGFFAKPVRTPQGVLDLKNWECGVPGRDKTLWEGGLFKLTVAFPDGQSYIG